MERYERVGVFLTDSPADEAAIGFAGRFAELAKSKKLVCAHMHGGDLELPEPESVDEGKLRQRLLAQLPKSVTEHAEIEIHTGKAIEEILRSARDLELDLIVKGRRLPAHQAAVGSAFVRLIRKAPCSVLVVPNHSRPHFSRLLVAVDFSAHSKLAVDAALEIARASSGCGESPQVVVHTVYSVGYGYHLLGQHFDEALARQREVATKKLLEFVADVDTAGVEFETVCTCSEDPAASVHEIAAARKMDMIVVGSRGLSPAAAVIMGGTAERILVRSPQPVLIVKRKGETVGLLNALLGQS